MEYIAFSDYVDMYPDSKLTDVEFKRLSWEASRRIDIATTGIDGVRKLRIAFPTDDYDVAAVNRCTAKLINTAEQILTAEKNAALSREYAETQNGIHSKIISSVSAGNESVSYSSSTSATTVIDSVLADKSAQEKLYRDIIREYLNGIKDSNGVNLLYMGEYPKGVL